MPASLNAIPMKTFPFHAIGADENISNFDGSEACTAQSTWPVRASNAITLTL